MFRVFDVIYVIPLGFSICFCAKADEVFKTFIISIKHNVNSDCNHLKHRLNQRFQ